MSRIRISGKKTDVQNALLNMLSEVWAYEQMKHRQIGEWAYIAALMQRQTEVRGTRFGADALNGTRKRRAARWAKR